MIIQYALEGSGWFAEDTLVLAVGLLSAGGTSAWVGVTLSAFALGGEDIWPC